MNDKTFLLISAAALGLWLAFVFGRIVVYWLQLLRMRFQPNETAEADRASMPVDVAAVLDQAGARLKALDFEYQGTWLTAPLLKGGDIEPTWSDLYLHTGSATQASVQVAEAPEPGLSAAVSFTTCYPDRIVATENRRLHLLFPIPPACDGQDALATGIEGHWASHRNRMAAMPGPAIASPEEVDRRVREFRASLFPFWREIGFMQPVGDAWRLTPGGAWRYLRQIMAGNRRLAALPPPADEEDLEVRLAADLHAWRASEAINRHCAMSLRSKVLWFVASAILGTAAMVFVNSWETVPLILGVLLFHEFGHALSMRAVGYRALGVLVLPFLGAVAIGRKEDAGPWEKLAVLLAGPLPGLMLAVVCLRLGIADPEHRDLLNSIGIMALVINLFNLLPFTPLDGGQMVDTFLFSRRPRLRLAFFIVSTVALVAVGIALSAPVLAGAGVALSFGIPAALRRMQLLSRFPFDSGEQPMAALLECLHTAPGRRLPFAHRLRTAQMLLSQVCGRAPSVLESLGGLSAYLAAVALPIGLLWDTGTPQEVFAHLVRPAAASHQPPDWRGQLAHAATPPERWQVLWNAGQWYEEEDDHNEARQRYQEALAETDLMPADESGELKRLDTRIALARVSGPDEALPSYLELLPRLRELPAAERQRLAEVLEALYWVDGRADAEERSKRLQEAIAVRESIHSPEDYRLFDDRLRLARHFDANGDTAGAEKLLLRNLEALSTLHSDSAAWLLEPTAWFYIAHGRAGDAERLLSAHAAPRQSGQQTLAWAYIAQGRNGEARELLAQQLKEKRNKSEWQRMQIFLDLVHGSAGESEAEAHWLQEAAKLKDTMGHDTFRGVRSYIRHEAESRDWERMRGMARLEAIKRLPGAEDDAEARPTTSCKAPA
ncbi:MAG TPA: site-2 protease family protein [Rhodocyclaceae bacterium]|nr:site-2 protease family protein [Rhodocyclaceae bacterium]